MKVTPQWPSVSTKGESASRVSWMDTVMFPLDTVTVPLPSV